MDYFISPLVPKHKIDYEAIDLLDLTPLDQYRPVIPGLFSWLADYNEPPCHALIPWFIKNSANLVFEIDKIFDSNFTLPITDPDLDDCKYAFVYYILGNTKDSTIEVFLPLLKRVAYSPTPGEIKTGAQEIAEFLFNAHMDKYKCKYESE